MLISHDLGPVKKRQYYVYVKGENQSNMQKNNQYLR